MLQFLPKNLSQTKSVQHCLGGQRFVKLLRRLSGIVNNSKTELWCSAVWPGESHITCHTIPWCQRATLQFAPLTWGHAASQSFIWSYETAIRKSPWYMNHWSLDVCSIYYDWLKQCGDMISVSNMKSYTMQALKTKASYVDREDISANLQKNYINI